MMWVSSKFSQKLLTVMLLLLDNNVGL